MQKVGRGGVGGVGGGGAGGSLGAGAGADRWKRWNRQLILFHFEKPHSQLLNSQAWTDHCTFYGTVLEDESYVLL